MGVVALRRVTVVLDASDASAIRDANDHRQIHAAAGAVAHLGHMRGDLFEGGVGERVELHLDDGTVAGQAHADREPDDARLGERRVEAPVVTELLRQTVGDAEHAAERADVLTEHEHIVVLAHAVAQRLIEGLAHYGAHEWSSRSKGPLRSIERNVRSENSVGLITSGPPAPSRRRASSGHPPIAVCAARTRGRTGPSGRCVRRRSSGRAPRRRASRPRRGWPRSGRR